MKNKPVRQHYVPKVYLKNFSSKDGFISVLKKDNNKIFVTGLNSIGAENNFYTLDKEKNPYSWENIYAREIEPLMGEVLSKIISNANILTQNNTKIVSEEDKFHLAFIMIIQLLRGKQTRDFTYKMFHSLLPEIVEQAKEKFGPLTKTQLNLIENFENDNYYFKRTAMEISLDNKRIAQLTRILEQRIFIFYRIHGDLEFVTSDNPVMFINIFTHNSKPFTNGLLQEDTLVFYPLSPRILLCAAHQYGIFRALSSDDRCLFHLNSNKEKTFINTINQKQKEQCCSQVYACSEEILSTII